MGVLPAEVDRAGGVTVTFPDVIPDATEVLPGLEVRAAAPRDRPADGAVATDASRRSAVELALPGADPFIGDRLALAAVPGDPADPSDPVSAAAIPHPPRIAAPTPIAAASAPTRPM